MITVSKLIAVSSIALALTALYSERATAQSKFSPETVTVGANGSTRTDSRILYHNGWVMAGSSNIYLIWYGCWSGSTCGSSGAAAVTQIVTDFVSSLGASEYFRINAGYPNVNGDAPNGGLIYGGSAVDPYSRGAGLTKSDLAAIVNDQMVAAHVPVDPSGIYAVLTSADVTVSDSATSCNLHGESSFNGTRINYVFVGGPTFYPGSCGAEFDGQPSPNANGAADATVLWLAHALNRIVTNPTGDGWYDRYGLENAQKCEDAYGSTYTVMNADGKLAEANMRLGQRHYLLQQNWVNEKKGHCAMSR